MDKTAKDRMRRYRNKKRNENGEDVTLAVTEKVKSVTLSNGVYIDRDKAIKLANIHNSLNQRIHGLCGGENMLDMVRYGTFTMREVGVALVTGEIT